MTTLPNGTERRQHHALREIFDEACALVAPVIESADKTLGVSSFSIMHVLRDHYPDLSQTEIHVLATAVERLHRERRAYSRSA